MKLGLAYISTDDSMPVPRLAELAEERGFESLWVPDHTHAPLNADPGPTPDRSSDARLLDPFVALAAAAAVTREIRLGTGVCLIAQRDTLQTAKQVASLDHVSDGRMEFGVGAGWNRVEMEDHGADFGTRFQKMVSQIEACKVIWQEDVVSYDGPFVEFGPMRTWPKPVQTPNPPIWLGGESTHTLRRVVAHCDGWLPRCFDATQVIEGMSTLRQMSEEAERTVGVSVFGAPPDQEVLPALAAAGAERAILLLGPGSEERVRARLDRLAEFVP